MPDSARLLVTGLRTDERAENGQAHYPLSPARRDRPLAGHENGRAEVPALPSSQWAVALSSLPILSSREDGDRVEVTTAGGDSVGDVIGFLVEFAPAQRHEIVASSKARLLLLLTPWPGDGHPGAITIREKLYARRHAAKRAA